MKASRKLESNTVDVWYLDVKTFKRNEPVLKATLSNAELSKAANFKIEKDRTEFLAARFAIRTLLSSYHPETPPQSWSFETGLHGKPVLAGPRQDVYFNLSHSGGMIACAIASIPEIGIDLENTTRDLKFLRLGERFFTRQEVEAMTALPADRQKEMFFKIWTLKEAFLKAKGTGISLPLKSFSFKTHNNTIEADFAPALQEQPTTWTFKLLDCPVPYQAAVAVKLENAVIKTGNFYRNIAVQ